MSATKIEWTDQTWNPVRGCTKITPGCARCYAATFAERFRGVPGHPYEQGFDLRLVPEKLLEPLTWPSNRRVFVNSMSDLFHVDVPTDFVVDVARVMAATPWHTYQVLTKRADRLERALSDELAFAAALPHVWWGVSVENRKHGLPRVAHLRRTKAAVKFLSIEPLLEDLGDVDLRGVDWVIVGGESGHGARPLDAAWVRSVRERAAAAGARFFFKQWGGVQKAKNGRVLDGRTWDDQPPSSDVPVPDKRARRAIAASLSDTCRRSG